MKQKQKIIEVYFIGETPCKEVSFMNLSISPIKSEKCNHEHKIISLSIRVTTCLPSLSPTAWLLEDLHSVSNKSRDHGRTRHRLSTSHSRLTNTLFSRTWRKIYFQLVAVETNFLLGLTERVDATRQMNFPITPILDRGWQPSKSRSHMQLSHLYLCFFVFVIGDKCEYLH